MLINVFGQFQNVFFEKTETFGIFITSFAPIILIAMLVLTAIFVMTGFKSRKKQNLNKILEKAKDFEVDCRYSEAWDLFLKYEKKAEPSAEIYFHMGMFCLSAKDEKIEGLNGNCDPAFWFEKAALMDHSRAKFYLLKLKFLENFPENLLKCAETFEEIRKIASEGLFEAERFLEKTEEDLGKKTEEGTLSEDEAKAVMGNTENQLFLGKNLLENKDGEKGFEWVLFAAEKGNVAAQNLCAEIYRERGKDVPEDMEKAFSWYEKAALAGDLNSSYMLGGLYYYGKGCEKNLSEAAKWFAKAADSGNAKASHNAYVCYRKLAEEVAEQKGIEDFAEKKLDEEFMEKHLLSENYKNLSKELGYK